MSLFLSRYVNIIDKKFRVSVPAPYRNSVASNEFSGIVVYPSIKHKCIESCSLEKLKEIIKMIENLDPYSEERDALETIILGEAVQLTFDKEGRVIIPKHLIEYSGIKNNVCFVGKGQVFEIWDEEEFNKYLENAKIIANNNRNLLKNIKTNDSKI